MNDITNDGGGQTNETAVNDQGTGSGAGAGQGSGTGGQGQGSSNPPALGWFPDATPEEIAFATAKGWDKDANPPAAPILKSYMNLQKLFGAHQAGSTVVVPGADADEATQNTFYEKLGRPTEPGKYSVEKLNGTTERGTQSFKEVAFKAGLSDKQVQALSEWNEGESQLLQDDMINNVRIEEASQISALKKEWGSSYDKQIQIAKEAATKFGWTVPQIDAMQMALGFDGLMKMANQVGAAIGEHGFVTSEGGRSVPDNRMTPEQATKELNKLSTDQDFQKAWMDKMHPRHKEMIDKKTQLTKWSIGQ